MSRAADTINFDAIKHFSANEWPAGALSLMEAKIILATAEIRAKLPADHRMKPSPLFAAHVRTSGTSRHSTQNGKRLSDATDIFMFDWAHARAAWLEAQRHEDIGGIGFYLDRWMGDPTNITPMLHFDCRPERMLWVCKDNEYVYFHSDPRRFFTLMGSV